MAQCIQVFLTHSRISQMRENREICMYISCRDRVLSQEENISKSVF